MLGQPGDSFDIEMVGRLVQHQQIVVVQQQRGQGDPATLATAEHGDCRVQVHPAEQVLDDEPGASLGRPDVVGVPSDDHIADRLARPEIVGLVQVADRC